MNFEAAKPTPATRISLLIIAGVFFAAFELGGFEFSRLMILLRMGKYLEVDLAVALVTVFAYLIWRWRTRFFSNLSDVNIRRLGIGILILWIFSFALPRILFPLFENDRAMLCILTGILGLCVLGSPFAIFSSIFSERQRIGSLPMLLLALIGVSLFLSSAKFASSPYLCHALEKEEALQDAERHRKEEEAARITKVHTFKVICRSSCQPSYITWQFYMKHLFEVDG